MIKNKILYLNNNRKQAGLLMNSGAADNMMLPRMDDLSIMTILRDSAIADFAEKYIKLFSIVLPSIFEKPTEF